MTAPQSEHNPDCDKLNPKPCSNYFANDCFGELRPRNPKRAGGEEGLAYPGGGNQNEEILIVGT